LLQVFEYASAYLHRSVQEAIAGRTDPVEQVMAGVYAYLDVFRQNADIARVLHREIRAAGPQQASRYELAILRFANLINQGVTEAYARGIAGRAPDETTVYALIGGLEAVGMRYVDRGDEERILEAAPVLVELVVRAFR
jgi:AcrR family transcriptional regulator